MASLTEKREPGSSTIYYLGKACSFEYNLLGKEGVRYHEGIFTFNGKVKDAQSEEKVLTLWFRKQAQANLTERVIHIARENNLKYNGIRINSAVTRWGSCSGQNSLNFPWRLIMAPVEVIDYVVVHELAHTIHKNHSSRFWGLVESIMPEWKIHRNYLKTNG